MKILSKHSIAVVGLMLAVSATPSTALARDSLHLNLPGISINVGDHRGNYNKRHHKKRYKSHRYNRQRYSNDYGHRSQNRHYRKRHHKNYYYGDYRPRDYRYKKRYYQRRNYNDNYYYGGSRYDRRDYYDRPRRSQICPVAGFSLYIDNSRSCYEHKDHYHCE